MNAVGKRVRKSAGDGKLSRYKVARARRKGRKGMSKYYARKMANKRGRGLLLAEAPGWNEAVEQLDIAG